MKRTILKIVVAVLAVVLLAEAAFIVVVMKEHEQEPQLTQPSVQQTETTQPPTETTQAATTLSTTEATEEPTTEPTTEATTEPETEPEPQPEHFTLSFAGDCTLGSAPNQYNVMYSFLWYVGDDYGYPFRNVLEYFENDDLTMVNLEGTFYEGSGSSSGARFTFKGPTKYVNLLTENSIEAVSFANNHTMDYRQEGYDSTLQTLADAGLPYVEKDGSMLMTTESGLTVGFYAVAFQLDEDDMEEEIQSLRDQGAEVVVVSIHWGAEGAYRPNADQTKMAYAAIDAGADIVYGHHPHVLQPIEEYNGGIIYYSLGNFCFGGHHWPQDLDSAILQQEIIRDVDGTISLGELTIIPVSCSSLPKQNNFQPTPYAEDSEEYARVISKLDGSWKGANLNVNYD